MLTFDMLLKSEGLDPSRVALARHQKSPPERNGTPFSLRQRDERAFELYQSLQGKPRFKDVDFVASFVVTPTGECLFVGMYKVNGVEKPIEPITDPLSGVSTTHCYLYNLSKMEHLSSYSERLVIDWGQGYIAWVQKGGGKKKIIEINRDPYEYAFPGFLKFHCNLSEIPLLPGSWKTRLTETRGVYLLTSMNDMRHYVGSATGEVGFYGRWADHLKASGDAVAFRNIPPSEYRLSVLQVASGLESGDDIVRIENAWMDKLQSRSMGLNGTPATSKAPETLA